MKIINMRVIIKSVRSKVDKSLSVTLSTPELSSKEMAEIMNLQGTNLDLLIKPLDEVPTELLKIDKDVDGKSPSQRLYAVMFIFWKQKGEQGDFNQFRRGQMEKLIDAYKEKLE